MSIKKSLTVFILILILFTGCSEKNTLSIKQLESEPTLPEWLEPVETDLGESMLDEHVAAGSNSENMKIALLKYHYLLTEYPQSDRVPFWLYMSAEFFLALDYDHLAYNLAEKVAALPDDFACNPELRNFPNLQAYKQAASLIVLNVLARNKLQEELEAYISNIKLIKSGQYFSAAKSYMLLGDSAKALDMVEKAMDDSNLEWPGVKSSYTSGAVAMAYAMGKMDKVKEYSQWMIEEGRDSKKYITDPTPNSYLQNQWQSNYDIVTQFRALADSGKEVKWDGLKDGSYEASVRGFLDLIDVSLQITGGKVESISANNRKDDKPFSAFETIPNRIMNYRSIEVDAISSATVSSSAIILAASEALIQAQ